jgi:small subunit ribosomal protein S13
VKTAAAAPRMQASFRRMPLKIEAARVGGVEIPNQKRIEFSLQYIFGIGHTTAKAILADTVSSLLKTANLTITRRSLSLQLSQFLLLSTPQSIDNKRTKDLSEEELTKLREEVDKYTTEGDLRRYVSLNIKRLKEINCYRGRRHYNVSRNGCNGC